MIGTRPERRATGVRFDFPEGNMVASLAEVLVAGGVNVHLVLVDFTSTGLDGRTAEDRLEEVGITVNRNAFPFDERPPMNPSGLRIGTLALTTRGFVQEVMREVARTIVVTLGEEFERESLGAQPGAPGTVPAPSAAIRSPIAKRKRGGT